MQIPLSKLQERVERKIVAHAKGVRAINVQSPQDMSWLLFEHLKLDPPPAAKKLKYGDFSTNNKVRLQSSRHPVQ